ncbi:MAG: hypothetical protein ACREH8_13005 [Opitutaceae bacterium]
MRRVVKVKGPATRVLLRKAAMTASAASRRGFPAWIDAGEDAIAFPAKTGATPRVRDGLVLRTVSKTKASRAKGTTHGNSAR